MAFRVGQKVVCVKKGSWDGEPVNIRQPQEKEIYTIETISSNLIDEMFFQFREIPHIDIDGRPVRWFSERFRPLVERKTSIEIFTKMLLPQKETV